MYVATQQINKKSVLSLNSKTENVPPLSIRLSDKDRGKTECIDDLTKTINTFCWGVVSLNR